ncbi:hypothetical protein [Sanguibacter antarcticus]|uniref:Uncharacterized protein n=1 Tax=Sanguibacter antarcticus TaxID=372484 RepID=A0A2A9E1W6_9MICO|nr:hypothetical protein [Sanguibacter antarcticus]PFG32833.1 hypothetical protein ATL42_0682 [Sanguibacter antarcticus]
MALFSRDEALPAELRAVLAPLLSRGDTRIAQASLVDGSWVVATRLGIAFLADAPTLRPWSDVDRGRWEPDTSTLVVQWVDGSTQVTLGMARPTRTAFLRVFRERVQSSVVMAETVHLPEGSSARVAVRRSATDGLFLQVVADPGADLRSASATALVKAAASRLSAASGAPSEG